MTTMDPSYWCRRQVISATPPSATVTFSVCTSCPAPGQNRRLTEGCNSLSHLFLSHPHLQSLSFPSHSVYHIQHFPQAGVQETDSSGGCTGHTGSPEGRETVTLRDSSPKWPEKTSTNGLLVT